MARGHGALRFIPVSLRLAGGASLLALATLAGGAFLGLLLEGAADGLHLTAHIDGYVLRTIRFTLLQAVLSTFLSIVLALAVARAISRHPSFPGRTLLLRLFGVPIALPAIVASLGVLALYGRAGLIAQPMLALTGQPWAGIYGLSGILIAHVFFNLPLATRLFLEALDTIAGDQWRLAAQLGMGPVAQWRMIEWPVLRASLPGICGLVLMLCVTSFTVVLTLGGGPGATTLEVAIYQALRFDFDPSRAVVLTLIQLAITLILLLAMTRLGSHFVSSGELSVSRRRHYEISFREKLANGVVILAAAAFVLGPMAAVVIAGLSADFVRLAGESSLRQAVATSLVLAFLAALLAVALSLAMVALRKRLEDARREGGPNLLERASDQGVLLILAMPPIVIGAGWFILLRRMGDVLAIAPVMVVIVNAAMAMPFVTRAIRPAYDRSQDQYARLADSLGIAGWSRWRLVRWPAMRQPLGTGFAFAMALSLGDLGVIALFGSERVQTLPYLLLQRLGSYRTDDAAGLALILGLLTLALMWLRGRGGDSI